MIKYEVNLYGTYNARKTDVFTIVRIERPDIRDAAGRKQWQKESKAEVRTVVLENVPISEIGSLLRAVADAASYYVEEVTE